MEVESKTSYCYYNLEHDCEKGLFLPNNAECRSCMVEAFNSIVRLNSTR